MCEYVEIQEKRVRVRKAHSCEWCSEEIERGSYAMRRVYRFQGVFNDARMHQECYDAYRDSDHKDVCDGWIPGDFERGVCATEDVTAMSSDEIRAELDAAGIDTDRIVQWVRTLARRKMARRVLRERQGVLLRLAGIVG